MNAKIERKEEYLGTIGKRSLHNEPNKNREMLIDFAASKNMVISSTYFSHRDIYKATWISSDGLTTNQIDHLLIEKRKTDQISWMSKQEEVHVEWLFSPASKI